MTETLLPSGLSPMAVPESGPSDGGPQRPPWRSGAAGELLANLGLAHAAISAALWISLGGWTSSLLVLAASGVAIVQCIGGLRSPRLSIGLPLAAAIAVCFVRPSQAPPWLADGPFSFSALAINLAGFVVLRLLHCGLKWLKVASPEVRRSFIGWTIGALFASYMIVFPVISGLLPQQAAGKVSRTVDDPTLSEQIQLHVMESFFAAFFFSIGATIGSFLNVVAYRLPLGKSVIARASRCPKCGTAIAPRDNLPVIGWLMLNGKCRTCALDISPRYPLVELTVGLIFLLLYFVELISGGINLPVRQPNTYAGVVWILMYTKWDLVGIYAYHCYLLCTLVAWSLLAFDGHPVPWRSTIVALSIAFVIALLLPWIHPLPSGFEWPAIGGIPGAIDSTAGALAGIVAGSILSFVLRATSAIVRPGLISACAMVGIVLGWQAALAVSATSLLLTPLATRILCRRGVSGRSLAMGCLLVTTLVYLCIWRLAHDAGVQIVQLMVHNRLPASILIATGILGTATVIHRRRSLAGTGFPLPSTASHSR